MCKTDARKFGTIATIWLLVGLLLVSCQPPTSTDAGHGTISRVAVSSSAMKSVGYSADRQILEIEFPNGSVYQYFEVPRDVYDGLMAAESHGRYFHKHIRSGPYQYERVQ